MNSIKPLPHTPNVRPVHERVLVLDSSISLGFPSPAEQYTESTLDLHELLIEHPSATFFAWTSGTSMQGAGIFDQDLLIVDRAVEPKDQSIVVVAYQGEFSCKRLLLKSGILVSEPLGGDNPYPPIPCNEDVNIEGVVKRSIRFHQKF